MPTKRVKDASAEAREAARSADETLVIPVIEEKLVVVGKEVVESGKVRISKQLRKHNETVDVPFLREEVAVERVPKDEFVEGMLPSRQEGDTMIIPVVEERYILQKRYVLVEELHVKKRLIEEHAPHPVTLMKEEVRIERVPVNKKTG